jgi:hypothetical protein
MFHQVCGHRGPHHPQFDLIQLRQVANGWEVKLPLLEFEEGLDFEELKRPDSIELQAEKKEPKIPRDESIFVFKAFDEVVAFLKTKIDETPKKEK